MGRTDRHPLHNTETDGWVGWVESTVVEVELLVMIRGVSDVLCSSCCPEVYGKHFVHTMHHHVCTNTARWPHHSASTCEAASSVSVLRAAGDRL